MRHRVGGTAGGAANGKYMGLARLTLTHGGTLFSGPWFAMNSPLSVESAATTRRRNRTFQAGGLPRPAGFEDCALSRDFPWFLGVWGLGEAGWVAAGQI